MTWSGQLSKGRPSHLAATAPAFRVPHRAATKPRLLGRPASSGWRRPSTEIGQAEVPRRRAATLSRANWPVSVRADFAEVPMLARSCPALAGLTQPADDVDTSDLQRLVSISQYCGNCELRHIRHAERLLCKEQEALRLKEVSETGNPQLMRCAVVRAEKAGVQKEVLDAARQSTFQLEALTMMEKAVMDSDTHALHNALQRAKGAKVAKQEIQAAEAILKQLRARDRLSVALKGNNIEAVRYAVREAQAQEVGGPELQEARHWLVQFEARRALESAMLKQDAEALRRCLAEASAAQLPRTPTVHRAEQLLGQMDARETLRTSLRGDPEELRAALAEARKAGVEARELNIAERFLRGPSLPATAAEASLRVGSASGGPRRSASAQQSGRMQ